MGASPAEGFSTIDVVGLGTVVVDDIFFLPEFPRPDSKLAVFSARKTCRRALWHHTGGPCYSSILVDTARTTRTILFDSDGVIGANPSLANIKRRSCDSTKSSSWIKPVLKLWSAPRALLTKRGFPSSQTSKELSISSLKTFPISVITRSCLSGMDDPGAAAHGLWSHRRSAVVGSW